MKLDANVLRYLGKDDFRTLTAVEMGQKNVRSLINTSKNQRYHVVNTPSLFLSIYVDGC